MFSQPATSGGASVHYRSHLGKHRNGQGARPMEVIKNAGLGFTLVRTWPGGRDRERQLKRQLGASQMCPSCGVRPQRDHGSHDAELEAAMKISDVTTVELLEVIRALVRDLADSSPSAEPPMTACSSPTWYSSWTPGSAAASPCRRPGRTATGHPCLRARSAVVPGWCP